MKLTILAAAGFDIQRKLGKKLFIDHPPDERRIKLSGEYERFFWSPPFTTIADSARKRRISGG